MDQGLEDRAKSMRGGCRNEKLGSELWILNEKKQRGGATAVSA